MPKKADDWPTQQCLDYLNDKGWIYIPRDGAGQPKYKQYLSGGIPYQDIWAYQPYTQGCLYGTDDCIALPWPQARDDGSHCRCVRPCASCG